MAKKFYYGGQAVIEGVMMRGRKNVATAVRRPDGSIAIDSHPLASLYTGRWRQVPLIRGVIVLIESLVLGMSSLMYSANISLEEEDKEKVSGAWSWLMVAVAVIFAVALFFMAPLFLTRLLHFQSTIIFNLVEGLIRVAIFLAYLRLMSFTPDIRRVFAYHGAEHKTVNAYEASAPLEVETVRRYSTAHPRCGTSFLFIVLALSILTFAVAGLHKVGFMVLYRITLLPLIAALRYGIIFFGSRHTGNWLVKVVLAPGMWLQAFTTREPDDSQLEVAITALKSVVADEEAPEPAQPASPDLSVQS